MNLHKARDLDKSEYPNPVARTLVKKPKTRHIVLLTLAPSKYKEHVFFHNLDRASTKTLKTLLA